MLLLTELLVFVSIDIPVNILSVCIAMDSKSSSISYLCSNIQIYIIYKIQVAFQLILILVICVDAGPRGKRGPPGLNGINGKAALVCISNHFLSVSLLLMMSCVRPIGIPGIQAWKHNNSTLLSMSSDWIMRQIIEWIISVNSSARHRRPSGYATDDCSQGERERSAQVFGQWRTQTRHYLASWRQKSHCLGLCFT